jgi:Calcineurin-like phosphoesterase
MTSKLIAISDLHLGQNGTDGLGQYSLLSTKAPQNLVPQLVQSVASFAAGDPITLLVAGDFLDLSIAYAEDALADLQALLSAFVGVVRLDEIVYCVGNHDHHLWSLHSEDKRLLAPLRDGRVPANGDEPSAKAMYQVTSTEGEPFSLLQPLVNRIFGSPAPGITISYPSYARALTQDTALYVTHGHLFGGLYTELSDLLKRKLSGLPHDSVAAMVNQPIIELIYWLLGETGEGLGADGLVEEIYTDMQRGTISRVRGLVTRLVAQILPHGVLWRVIGSLERKIVVDAVMDELGKVLLSPPASANASADRYADLETTRAGLRTWMEAIDWPKQQPTIVLYGHTHVWDDYAIPDTGVHSWNLSTWLVEPNHPPPRTGFLGISGADARWIDVS